MHVTTRRFGVYAKSLLSLGAAAVCLFAPHWSGLDAQAIPAWSRKHNVDCHMCHAPNFARLNYYGERYLANGYQNPNTAVEEAEGDKEGKTSLSPLLSLDPNVGHWFTARLNLTPVQYETNARFNEGDTTGLLTLGNTNWLQLFVGGTLSKNVSIYIENEITTAGIHQAWYYLGLHNIFNTRWLNFHAGRVSPTVLSPYPDRLPQQPAVGRGVYRVGASRGLGGLSLSASEAYDLRSARFGVQWYAWDDPLVLYAGASPGTRPSNQLGSLGFWAGARFIVPEGVATIEGSSIGVHLDTGTDARAQGGDSANIENDFMRIAPMVNLRLNQKLDIQAAYVIATESNRSLIDPEPADDFEYTGIRAVGTYYLTDRWNLGFHYDNFESSEDLAPGARPSLEQHTLFLPVITYLWRQNFRVSLYPGFDLLERDNDALTRHLFLINIRTAI